MRVAIVGGGGGVGASAAFNLLVGGGAHDVVLVDARREMAISHALDLEQVVELAPGGSIRDGDPGDVAAADVVVLAGGAPLKVNTTRLAYLEDNAAIVRENLTWLPDGWPGVLLMVTNPVDALVTWTHRHTGIDRRRVVGYTLNDSLRMRTAIGQQLGIEPGRVEAWVLGEHGDATVPLWDRIRIDGEPAALDPEVREAAAEWMGSWYRRHVALDSGRSSTWTSGLGIARMIAALEAGGDEPWPGSVVLEGEYGLSDVAVGVPVRLGPGGVREIVAWDLGAEAAAGLARAAEVVAGIADDLDAQPSPA